MYIELLNPNGDQAVRQEVMEDLYIYDEDTLIRMHEKAQRLKKSGVINENKKIKIKIT